jgi:hypothetical protein
MTGHRADYRQAGSPAAELMADAQAMMAGEPLDSAAEAAVIELNLRPRDGNDNLNRQSAAGSISAAFSD